MPSTALVLTLSGLVLAVLGVVEVTRNRVRARRQGEPVRRWVSGRATTADGVTAELHLEFVLRPESGPLDEALDRSVQDAVEDAVREAIVAANVDGLPDAGDRPDWLAGMVVPGARIEHAVVSAAEVWVTPELRRLVARRGVGPGAWT